jgi:mannitol/fructose-specific phosphotransferase system IIA component (Ntr-type)
MMNAADWTEQILHCYRKAAEATAEAREFDKRAAEIIAKMEAKGVTTFGELFAVPDTDSEAR